MLENRREMVAGGIDDESALSTRHTAAGQEQPMGWSQIIAKQPSWVYCRGWRSEADGMENMAVEENRE